MPLKSSYSFKVYGKYFIMENDSQFGYPVGHEFAFYFRWVDYTDFPVGDYVTCNGNKARSWSCYYLCTLRLTPVEAVPTPEWFKCILQNFINLARFRFY